PLTGIRSSLDVIEGEGEGGDKEVVDEFLGLARREIDRADRLIGELLNFAKPRSLQREMVVVSKLIEETRALIDAQAQGKGVVIELELNNDQSLSGDVDQLKQVLINLMLNAIQHAPEQGGRVSVTLSLAAQSCIIEVEDNGPGVSVENAGRVFDPFFTTRAKGVGLGLAISHQIIGNHGGELTHTRSEMLKGACFRVVLPIHSS
ncbi:MAG: ATP-binding protein, partial [Planctomycetota bacterium]|nr:ATP-binding protein [Planctomycetota bacterium]